MWLKKSARLIDRVISQISRRIHSVAAGTLAAMMFLTFTDVCLRYVFNKPIAGSYEITTFLMAILIAFGLAYCALLKGHVTIELVISRFPQRAQAIINSITCLIGLGLVFLITWQTALLMKGDFDSGRACEVLRLPTFPFIGAVALGSAIFTLVLVTHFIEFLSQAVRK